MVLTEDFDTVSNSILCVLKIFIFREQSFFQKSNCEWEYVVKYNVLHMVGMGCVFDVGGFKTCG